MTHNFRKLRIWNEGMSEVHDTFKMTRRFSDFERYCLISKMNRGSISNPSNVAVRSIKSTNGHIAKYLEISLGSAFEWETPLITALKKGYVDAET